MRLVRKIWFATPLDYETAAESSQDESSCGGGDSLEHPQFTHHIWDQDAPAINAAEYHHSPDQGRYIPAGQNMGLLDDDDELAEDESDDDDSSVRSLHPLAYHDGQDISGRYYTAPAQKYDNPDSDPEDYATSAADRLPSECEEERDACAPGVMSVAYSNPDWESRPIEAGRIVHHADEEEWNDESPRFAEDYDMAPSLNVTYNLDEDESADEDESDEDNPGLMNSYGSPVGFGFGSSSSERSPISKVKSKTHWQNGFRRSYDEYHMNVVSSTESSYNMAAQASEADSEEEASDEESFGGTVEYHRTLYDGDRALDVVPEHNGANVVAPTDEDDWASDADHAMVPLANEGVEEDESDEEPPAAMDFEYQYEARAWDAICRTDVHHGMVARHEEQEEDGEDHKGSDEEDADAVVHRHSYNRYGVHLGDADDTLSPPVDRDSGEEDGSDEESPGATNFVANVYHKKHNLNPTLVTVNDSEDDYNEKHDINATLSSDVDHAGLEADEDESADEDQSEAGNSYVWGYGYRKPFSNADFWLSADHGTIGEADEEEYEEVESSDAEESTAEDVGSDTLPFFAPARTPSFGCPCYLGVR
ncbi:hypothetical protein C8R46DRAFT_40023 [Mycena filopes]|nr:hypothetical protein C8R46DRAFT_40023 [Mycena filopes]